jgi:hypothetical protein
MVMVVVSAMLDRKTHLHQGYPPPAALSTTARHRRHPKPPRGTRLHAGDTLKEIFATQPTRS